jgi:hypothetical protein
VSVAAARPCAPCLIVSPSAARHRLAPSSGVRTMLDIHHCSGVTFLCGTSRISSNLARDSTASLMSADRQVHGETDHARANPSCWGCGTRHRHARRHCDSGPAGLEMCHASSTEIKIVV